MIKASSAALNASGLHSLFSIYHKSIITWFEENRVSTSYKHCSFVQNELALHEAFCINNCRALNEKTAMQCPEDTMQNLYCFIIIMAHSDEAIVNFLGRLKKRAKYNVQY